jgi:serine protease AprX
MLRSKLVFFCLIISLSALGQTNRYFVFFKNKTGTPYSISDPSQFLSSKSIARRQKQGIATTEEDLPVNPSYVTQIKTTGAKTFFTSRWWNGVLVETNAATIGTINSLPFVKESILVAPGSKLIGGRNSKVKHRKNSTSDEPVNQFQLEQIGLDEMQLAGYRGEGISIAIFDSGFQGVDSSTPFSDLFTENRVKQKVNFVTNGSSVFVADDHGTEVLSVMGAYDAGSYTGGAYKADFFLYLTEDVSSEYRVEEYNWTFAAERADSAGVDIINSSLGYNQFDDSSMDYETSDLNGKTAVVTQAARKAIEKGMIVVCSAGNEGASSWKLVTPPADAAGVLAIGSITSLGTLSGFSSKGPTADSRIKPDVVALGSGTSVIKPSGALGTASGTSLSSPLIASLVAGVWQAYPFLNVAEVYNAITSSATLAEAPNNQMGYGIPNFKAIRNYIESSQGTSQMISVFPNPVSGTSFSIKLNELSGKPVLVTIYDSRGSRVAESSLQISWINNPFEYDISLLTSGLYFVRVQSGSNLATLKITKL